MVILVIGIYIGRSGSPEFGENCGETHENELRALGALAFKREARKKEDGRRKKSTRKEKQQKSEGREDTKKKPVLQHSKVYIEFETEEVIGDIHHTSLDQCWVEAKLLLLRIYVG